MLHPPLHPMAARPADRLPMHAGLWAYEPKLDGARCLATVAGGRARLLSRQLRPLTSYFPEVVAALENAFVDVVLDGELVVELGGRLDFTALARRLASGRRARHEAPACFVAFDALSIGPTDIRRHPYHVRRTVLSQLLEDACPPLAVMPMTTDGQAARAWLTGHQAAGVEGVVAKRLDRAYTPGTKGWSKIKVRHSTEAIIGGVLGSLRAPVALVLGRVDAAGRLRVVGRTGPLPRTVRREIGAALRPATGSHPWPPMLPPARWGDTAPVEYMRVEPLVVVELVVDAAVDDVRDRVVWRHPARFVRIRADLRPSDLAG